MPKYYNEEERVLLKKRLFELVESRGLEKIKYLRNKKFSRDFLLKEYEYIEHVW